jgi:Protein of unknown function (DUF4236)/zinc-ribbon domain
MGYIRLFRRVRLAPGLTLNLSKSGPSLSVGMRGAHITLGRSGIRRTVGLPGTGLFYTTRNGWHSGIHSAPEFREAVCRQCGRPLPDSDQFCPGCGQELGPLPMSTGYLIAVIVAVGILVMLVIAALSSG